MRKILIGIGLCVFLLERAVASVSYQESGAYAHSFNKNSTTYEVSSVRPANDATTARVSMHYTAQKTLSTTMPVVIVSLTSDPETVFGPEYGLEKLDAGVWRIQSVQVENKKRIVHAYQRMHAEKVQALYAKIKTLNQKDPSLVVQVDSVKYTPSQADFSATQHALQVEIEHQAEGTLAQLNQNGGRYVITSMQGKVHEEKKSYATVLVLSTDVTFTQPPLGQPASESSPSSAVYPWVVVQYPPQTTENAGTARRLNGPSRE